MGDGVSDVDLSIFVGRPVSDFITCAETAHVYELLLDRVRKSQQPLQFEWRCDDAEYRRFMKMHMVPAASGLVTMKSELLRDEPRPRVAVLDPSCTERSNATLTICAWCACVRDAHDRWVEIEDAIPDIAAIDGSLPHVSHGVCPTCSEELYGLIHDG